VLLEKLTVAHLVTQFILCYPKVHSQPGTGPGHEPDKSTPHTTCFLKIHFNFIRPSTITKRRLHLIFL
jgi:hypothetical protein